MRSPRTNPRRRGAALIEYGLLIAGVALVVAAAVTTYGNKTSDILAVTAVALPGVNPGENAPILSGRILEVTDASDGVIQMDTQAILDNTDTARLENNLGVPGFNEGLILEPGQ